MNNEIKILPEYDINIPSIILVHKYEYTSHSTSSIYESGRMSYGFVYVIEGNAEYVSGGEDIQADKNTILFLPEKSRYSVINKTDKSFLHFTVNFCIIPDADKNGVLYDYISKDKILSLKTANPAFFEAMFLKLLTIWNSKKSGFHLEAKAQLYQLANEFFSEFAASKISKNDYERILPVKRYIDENFYRTLKISDLSAVCGLSDTHMRRLFTEVFCISPIEYQIDLRILRAKDLLLTGLYTVGETAEMCGFSDANYFTRIFSTRVGISPLKYKKAH